MSARKDRIADPATCQRPYTQEELEVLQEVDRYRQKNQRPFPTICEFLHILKGMGYQQTQLPCDRQHVAS